MQAQEIFQIILQFRDAVVSFYRGQVEITTKAKQDNYYNATLAEAARHDGLRDEARVSIIRQDQIYCAY